MPQAIERIDEAQVCLICAIATRRHVDDLQPQMLAQDRGERLLVRKPVAKGDRLASDDQAGQLWIWRGDRAGSSVSPGIDAILDSVGSPVLDPGASRRQQDPAEAGIGATDSKFELTLAPKRLAAVPTPDHDFGGRKREQKGKCDANAAPPELRPRLRA